MSLFQEKLPDGKKVWKAILRLEDSGRIDGLLQIEDIVESQVWVKVLKGITEDSKYKIGTFLRLEELVRGYYHEKDPMKTDRQLTPMVKIGFNLTQ